MATNKMMARDIVEMIIEDAKAGYPDYNADQLHEVLKVSLGNAFDAFCEASVHYRLCDVRRGFVNRGMSPYNNELEGLLDEIILSEMDCYTRTIETEIQNVIDTIGVMTEKMFAEIYNLTDEEKKKFHEYRMECDNLDIEWTVLDVKNFTPENNIVLDGYFEKCFGFPHYSNHRFLPSADLRKCTELVRGTINDNMSMTFAIINTKDYDNGDNMGYTIVQGISPQILYNYGFDTSEVEEAGTLPIGASMLSYMYGTGCVVVRIS